MKQKQSSRTLQRTDFHSSRDKQKYTYFSFSHATIRITTVEFNFLSQNSTKCAERVSLTLRQACYRENPGSAMCVQSFNDSRGFAIRITYRISLRSSSLWEPRHPLLKVVIELHSLITPPVYWLGSSFMVLWSNQVNEVKKGVLFVVPTFRAEIQFRTVKPGTSDIRKI